MSLWRGQPSLSQLIIERVQHGAYSVEELASSLNASAESVARILRRHRAHGWVIACRDGLWSSNLGLWSAPDQAASQTYWPK